jgi:hypothetical protein
MRDERRKTVRENERGIRDRHIVQCSTLCPNGKSNQKGKSDQKGRSDKRERAIEHDDIVQSMSKVPLNISQSQETQWTRESRGSTFQSSRDVYNDRDDKNREWQRLVSDEKTFLTSLTNDETAPLKVLSDKNHEGESQEGVNHVERGPIEEIINVLQ